MWNNSSSSCNIAVLLLMFWSLMPQFAVLLLRFLSFFCWPTRFSFSFLPCLLRGSWRCRDTCSWPTCRWASCLWTICGSSEAASFITLATLWLCWITPWMEQGSGLFIFAVSRVWMHRSSNICKNLLPGHFINISWVFSEAFCSFTFLRTCRDPLWWRVYLGEPPAVLPWPTEHQLEGHFGSTQHRHQTPTAASCPELWAPSQPAKPSTRFTTQACVIDHAADPPGLEVWSVRGRTHRAVCGLGRSSPEITEMLCRGTWGVPPLPAFCVLVKYDIPQTGLGALSPCPTLVTV